MTRNKIRYKSCLLSRIEPKTVRDALEDEGWCKAIEEDIERIEKNKNWSLVLRPANKNVIGTKWVFRKNLDENGEIIRKKARIVCKGYAQEEGLDHVETFSPIARMEGVRTLLAYVSCKGF